MTLHAPQFMLLFCVLISQPLAGTPSQFANPVVQLLMAQLPDVHTGLAFGRLQMCPHVPQLLRSARVETSQPSAFRPLQLANPELQLATKQLPVLHTSFAFGRLQTLPHPPQLLASLCTSTSQPSPGMLLQSERPAAQMH